MDTCWICSSPADTSEHKIKKSLLGAVHGDGPYDGEKAVAHFRRGELKPLRGPNAKQVKFKNVLCAFCNNSRTQPFDVAFDKFHKFLLAQEKSIVDARVIDFFNVYGQQFPTGQLNLFKYFAKLMGCDLAANGRLVPDDLRLLLDQQKFMTKFAVSVAVNEDKTLMPNATWRPLGFHDLWTTQRNLRTNDDPHYRWGLHLSCVEIFFWYDWMPDGPYGSAWIANSRYVYLGYVRPLNESQRTEMREKLVQLRGQGVKFDDIAAFQASNAEQEIARQNRTECGTSQGCS